MLFVSVKCPADRQHGLEGKQHSHDFEMSHDNGPVDTSTGESPSSAAFSRLRCHMTTGRSTRPLVSLRHPQRSHDFELSHDNGPVDTSTGESPSSAAFSRL